MTTGTVMPKKISEIDPWLEPFQESINHRSWLISHQLSRIQAGGVSLVDFALAHEYYGLHFVDNEWILRERAPNATRVVLVGDFSNWELRAEFRLARISKDSSDWEIRLPSKTLNHTGFYKLVVFWHDPHSQQELCGERIPAFARRVVQNQSTLIFSAQVWKPERAYRWKNPDFVAPKRAPRIYEAHVGMATEEYRVATYREFTDLVLPRIAKAGYNTVQLMAVQEHPYYGSFGYQVSNFFAPSSRFGTPEELMELVDTAHGLGLSVIMDLVHSHAVKNEIEGLGRIDGSYNLYFHEGDRGEHPAWNTRIFDYGKIETLHLLLSNCRYWLDVFKFDGFRFDGVTSMLYRDHGLGTAVSSYYDYFSNNVDDDAVAYLALANKLIHDLRPDAITIAEEVSAMPGLAAPLEEQGLGFDFRLAMGVPDYWIKLLKHTRDEDWNVAEIWRELASKRAEERTIGYCESHDQAMVGDKTIIFWLADKEMYWQMRIEDSNPVIDRAMALHKMIRLITLGTAGNGYLNFMGNEFGHPEWIDFPREGNGWSFKYARRQWSLCDDPKLKYGQLACFDRALMKLSEVRKVLDYEWPKKIYEHVADQVLAFERGGLLFVFNFSPQISFEGRSIPCFPGEYRILLDTDSAEFGGFGRIDRKVVYPANSGEDYGVKLYIPSRTGLILGMVE
jgi:1,4-alpha-glucan branching enzyme